MIFRVGSRAPTPAHDKPQAARGSGAEPVAAAAVIYVQANPGRDTMPKALGPAATTRTLSFKSGKQGGLERAKEPVQLLFNRT